MRPASLYPHGDNARQRADEDAALGERGRGKARRGADGECGAWRTRCGIEGIQSAAASIKAVDGVASYN